MQKAHQMCTSFIAPLSDAPDMNVCLRCGWNHRDEREKAEIQKIRALLPAQQRAGIKLYYHNGLSGEAYAGREAIADIAMLLARLERLDRPQEDS